MRAVVQRVSCASVEVGGAAVSQIGWGLLVLLGVARGDTGQDVEWMAERILNLRIFDDEKGTMNLSVQDVGGEILAVSQFTLLADARKGRRPSYADAAPPEEARARYDALCDRLARSRCAVKRGVFQAMMNVALINDGPITILLDSEKKF